MLSIESIIKKHPVLFSDNVNVSDVKKKVSCLAAAVPGRPVKFITYFCADHAH